MSHWFAVPALAQAAGPAPLVVVDHTFLYVSIITGVLSLLSTVFAGIMAYLVAKLNTKADVAAVERTEAAVAVVAVKDKLAEVQSVTDTKVDATLQAVTIIKDHVNHNLRIVLAELAEALERLAAKSRKKADRIAADKARKALVDHDAGQALVDAKVAAAQQHGETVKLVK